MNTDENSGPNVAEPIIHLLGQPSLTIQKALELAASHFESRRLTEAENLYQKIVSGDSNQPFALHQLGIIANQKGAHKDAVNYLTKAISLQPEYTVAHFNLGIIHQQLGQVEVAIECFKRALLIQPDLVEGHINLANALKEQGHMDQALESYRKAIAVNPQYARAHYSLGLAFHDANEFDAAMSSYRSAINIKPDYIEAQNNLGNVYKKLGRFGEAVSSYQSVLSVRPDMVEVHNNLANAFVELGRLEDAVSSYQDAIELQKNYVQAHFGLGTAYRKMGKIDEAAARFQTVIGMSPDYAEAHYYLGGIQHKAGDLDSAIQFYRKEIDINPNFKTVHNDLGAAYLDRENFTEALDCFQAALSLDPNYVEAYNNRGNALKSLGRNDEAETCYLKALELAPLYPDAHNNLGVIYRAQGLLDKALASFRSALNFDPNHIEAQNHMGTVYLAMGEPEQAISCHEKAIELHPNDPLSYWWLSNTLLSTEGFARGWDLYGWRWKVDNSIGSAWRNFPQSMWDGSDLTGKRILVWGEQGIGDEIMFATMLPDLQKMAGSVVVECLDRLHPIFTRSFPDIEFIVRHTPPLDVLKSSDIDYQIPAGGLGKYLRKEKPSFPKLSKLLVPNSEQKNYFRSKYTDKWPRKRLVGIAWHSVNKKLGVDKSLSLKHLQPLLSCTDCQFINLQYGNVENELSALKDKTGLNIYFDKEIDPLVNMDAFNSQVSALDLVVSTSNTTVHVAGALGVPTWVMVNSEPSWRWFLGSDDSVWYPSVRLYRQQRAENWSGVIEQIRKDLMNNKILDHA